MCVCRTSQVQIWQGSLAAWKLSPGPYTLPSNTQSTQKQSYKIIKYQKAVKKNNKKHAANVLWIHIYLPAHTGQHSPGTLMKLMQGDRQRTSEQVVTPSTHMQVIQGVESANQLLPSVCSSLPYTQPEKEISITGKTISSGDYYVQWSIYLYSEDSRLLDQSPDAYKAAWDTQETHTAPHLPAREISTETQRKGANTEGEERNGGVRPGKCRWSSGLNSGSMSGRQWTPVHQACTLRPERDKRQRQT